MKALSLILLSLYCTSVHAQLYPHVLQGSAVRCMIHHDGLTLLGTKGDSSGTGKVLALEKEGKQWSAKGTAVCSDCEDVQTILRVDEQILLAGTWKNGLYRSDDLGKSWSRLDSCPAKDVRSLVQTSRAIYAATTTHGILMSTNAGDTWAPAHHDSLQQKLASWHLDVLEGSLWACTFSSGLMTSDDGESWEQKLNPKTMKVWDVAKDESKGGLYAACSGEEASGLYLSEDSGETWSLMEGVPHGLYNHVSVSPNGTLYLGSWDNGAWSYQGGNWRPIAGTYGHGISGMVHLPGKLIISTWDDGVLIQPVLSTGHAKSKEEASSGEE